MCDRSGHGLSSVLRKYRPDQLIEKSVYRLKQRTDTSISIQLDVETTLLPLQARWEHRSMMKTFALAALAVAILSTGSISNIAEAADIKNKTCNKLNGGTFPCTYAEWKKQQRNPNLKQRNTGDRAARMQEEMDAEALAYKKMSEERKRNAPTTEHCYMKNGNLECKPAP